MAIMIVSLRSSRADLGWEGGGGRAGDPPPKGRVSPIKGLTSVPAAACTQDGKFRYSQTSSVQIETF